MTKKDNMKTKSVIVIMVFLCALHSFAQMRVTIGGNSYINLENQAKLVIDNPSADALNDMSLATGGIISENEFDQVVWIIGNSLGNFTLPYVTNTTLEKIPFTLQITVAGNSGASSSIRFSTYPGSNWNNDTYRPSDVTHMSTAQAGPNNSDHVIDRFWINDAVNYVTKPTVNLSITYRDIEHLQIGNTIIEASLRAQRFNNITSQWGDYSPQGTTNTMANNVNNVTVSPADFYRSWTLSEMNYPLASDLIEFSGKCEDGVINLIWKTNFESMIDYYVLDRFTDNQWETIGTILPQNLANTINTYHFDYDSRQGVLFRLSELDMNGFNTVKGNLFVDCETNENFMSFEENNLTIGFYSKFEEDSPIKVFDAAGKLVFQTSASVKKNNNIIIISDVNLSKGVYLVSIGTSTNQYNEKIINYK